MRPRVLPLLALLGALLGTSACTAPNPDYDPRGLRPDAGGEADAPKPDRPVDAPVLPPDIPADLPPIDLDGTDLLPDVAGTDLASDLPAALGQPCISGATCASGTCVHNVCCNTDCRDRCWSCTLPSALGTCTIVPLDQDPHDDCPAEAASTCGRSGACNGAGACSLHTPGTQCRPQTCTAGIETAANLCDGAGNCAPGTSRACPLTECTGDSCAVECSATVACATGSQCVAGRCMGNGPVLHWRFDEAAGTMALDASGNNFSGTYGGDSSQPAPSSTAAPTMFANPRGRTFPSTGRPGVSLPATDPRLLLTNNFSISLWFRATSAPTNGGAAFSINLDVMLRVGAKTIEFAKRKSTVEGQIYAIAMAQDVPNNLDGRWHHLVGTISTKGMDVYVDTVPRKHDSDGQPVIYLPNGALWAGREMAAGHDFRGDLDDLRVYNRVLSTNEIKALFDGNP